MRMHMRHIKPVGINKQLLANDDYETGINENFEGLKAERIPYSTEAEKNMIFENGQDKYNLRPKRKIVYSE